MKNVLAVLLLALLTTIADAQITITRSERLPLSRGRQWSHPRFSPTGRSVFYSDADGNGIWEYTLKTRSARRITADAKSGLSFSVSQDGKSLVYRRTLQERPQRRQAVVLINIARGTSSVLGSGSDVSTPVFSANTPVYTIKSKTSGLAEATSAARTTILGIENTKIAISVEGKKTILDPLGNGSYIWPALSPDGKQLVAYDMDRGAFVCDVDGSAMTKIGKRDAPTWTRSGKWIVYMEDKDDGHRILSSDLAAVSFDGKSVVQLTSTASIFEMNPQCSPSENKIVCNNTSGMIFVLEYEER
jgi:Tol biopolymer transport system component